jgi:hypothetical protein
MTSVETQTAARDEIGRRLAAKSQARNWSLAPGRVGFWLSLAGLLLAIPSPIPAFAAATLGLGL